MPRLLQVAVEVIQLISHETFGKLRRDLLVIRSWIDRSTVEPVHKVQSHVIESFCYLLVRLRLMKERKQWVVDSELLTFPLNS